MKTSRQPRIILLVALLQLVDIDGNDHCHSAFSCNHHGHCASDHNGDHGYPCICDPGFHGRTCSQDQCHSSPCQNQGQCSVTTSDPFYHCNCTSGYTGSTCQRTIPSVPATCDDVSVVTDMARKTVSSADQAAECPDSQTRNSPEAFVIQHCTVDSHPDAWAYLPHPLYTPDGSCGGVALYTPVAAINSTRDFYMPSAADKVAGIFVGCLDDGTGFKLAVQNCGSPPQVVFIHDQGKIYHVLALPGN